MKATIRAVFKQPEGLGDNEVAEALVKHVHSTNVNDSWHEFQFGFLNMHPPPTRKLSGLDRSFF